MRCVESKVFTHQVYSRGFTVTPELLQDDLLDWPLITAAAARAAHASLEREIMCDECFEEEEGPYMKQAEVYIAGPMRGLADYNFPAFYQAEAMLDLWGFKVHNPARMDIRAAKAGFNRATQTVIPDTTFKIEEVLRRDFDAIKQCDAVIVLPGWEKSSGAQRELAFAQSIGIPVFKFDVASPLDIEAQKPLNLEIKITITDKDDDDLPF